MNEKYHSETDEDGYEIKKIPTNRHSVVIDPEKLYAPGEEPLGFFAGQKRAFRDIYFPIDDPVWFFRLRQTVQKSYAI